MLKDFEGEYASSDSSGVNEEQDSVDEPSETGLEKTGVADTSSVADQTPDKQASACLMLRSTRSRTLFR